MIYAGQSALGDGFFVRQPVLEASLRVLMHRRSIAYGLFGQGVP
jgi:hypothetical protein